MAIEYYQHGIAHDLRPLLWVCEQLRIAGAGATVVPFAATELDHISGVARDRSTRCRVARTTDVVSWVGIALAVAVTDSQLNAVDRAGVP